MTIECVVHGRYVIVYNERKDGVDYPDYYFAKVFNELCEVEVYGELNYMKLKSLVSSRLFQ